MAPAVAAADKGHWVLDFNGQENGHRVFFPALALLLVTRLGGWSELRETLFGVAFLTLGLAVLWQMASRTLPAPALPYAFLWISMLVFSLVQYEDLFWAAGGFGWLIPNLAALVAVWLYSMPRVSWLHLAGAFVASFVASYSGAFGLNTLFVGALLLLLAHPFDWKKFAAWCVGTIALLALFFQGYDTHMQASSFTVSHDQLLSTFPLYVLTYLSSPLGYWPGQTLSEVLGALLLVAFFCALAFAIVRRVRGADVSSELPWLGLCTFAVLSGMLTAYGRGGLGVGQALSSRYTVIAGDLWIGLSMVAFLGVAWLLRERRVPAPILAPICIVAALICLNGYIRTQNQGIAEAQDFTARIQRGLLALRSIPQANDEDLGLLYPDPVMLRRWLRELSAVHERPFTPIPGPKASK